jgi:protein involved in polysaccharide export with SLBB domain
MEMHRIVWTFFFVVTFAGDAFAQSGSLLRPGDAVRIKVWGHDELSGEFAVTAEGHIAHPVFRTVRVVGIPPHEVDAKVKDALLAFEQNPRFVVEILFRVLVGGEVRQPSLYLLPRETTVAQAVGLAGGVTERGQLEKVDLLRGGQLTVVDLTSAQGGNSNIPVNSGDQIYVHARRSVFREVVIPTVSILAALASIANLVVN